jgi:hypothetical protein
VLNGLARDFNGYFSLFLLFPLSLLVLRHVARPVTALAAATLLVVSYGFMTWSSDHVHDDPMEGRWVFPMLDDIGQRILPDKAATQYFEARGMPMNDTLRSMTGKLAFEGEYPWQYYRDPNLQGFRDWLGRHSKTVYLEYLFSHPGYTVRRVWDDRQDVFQAFDYRLDPYPDSRYDTALPPDLRLTYDTNLPPRVPLVVAYVFGGIGSIILICIGGLRRSDAILDAGLLTAALFAMLLPLSIVVDHADTMETARHSVSLPAQAVLVSLTVAFFALIESKSAVAKPRRRGRCPDIQAADSLV